MNYKIFLIILMTRCRKVIIFFECNKIKKKSHFTYINLIDLDLRSLWITIIIKIYTIIYNLYYILLIFYIVKTISQFNLKYNYFNL